MKVKTLLTGFFFCLLIQAAFPADNAGDSRVDNQVLKVITPSMIGSTGYTITEPGTYGISDDVHFAPDYSCAALTIKASNVTLDLHNKMICQSNSVNNVYGILIAPHQKEVVVKNGHIHGMTADALVVNEGCSAISINTMKISGCYGSGICTLGTHDNPVKNCEYTQCVITSCLGHNEVIDGNNEIFYCEHCSDVVVRECAFDNNGDTAKNLVIFCLVNCARCTITDCNIGKHNLSKRSILGLYQLKCTDCSLKRQ